MTDAEPSSKDYAIQMSNQLAFTPRKLRVITVGAGFSGLMVAHKFQHAYPELQDVIEHKIFESRSDLGGTWLVNTYPGVQCDVPSHIYVSFPLKTLELFRFPMKHRKILYNHCFLSAPLLTYFCCRCKGFSF